MDKWSEKLEAIFKVKQHQRITVSWQPCLADFHLRLSFAADLGMQYLAVSCSIAMDLEYMTVHCHHFTCIQEKFSVQMTVVVDIENKKKNKVGCTWFTTKALVMLACSWYAVHIAM